MEIKRYESNGRFCRTVVYGGLLFTSGLVEAEQETFDGQACGIFQQIDDLLEKYGSSRERILSANVFLKNASDFDAFNALWLKWIIPGCEPVRTTVAAEMMHSKILIEINAIAAL